MKKYWLLIILFIALALATFFAWRMYSSYLTAFPEILPAKGTRADWGVIGNFFGGTLNPIFSLLGLVMLLVTLFQNQTELELSRVELSKSNQALMQQASTLEKQRFEDTFFALLDQLHRLLERLLSDGIRYDYEGNASTSMGIMESIKAKLLGTNFERISDLEVELPEAKRMLLAHNPLLNQYFRILYQILKFIAVSSPNTGLVGPFSSPNLGNSQSSADEKFYSNLVRSFVPENVYYFLAVNCFSETANDQYYPYKQLIERYEFLEHMPLVVPEHHNRLLVRQIIDYFESSAFGSNPAYKLAVLG